MRYIVIILVYIFALLSFTISQGADGEGYSSFPAYEVTVDEKEALFKFPLNPREHYEWCSGGLQYSWSVEVAENSKEEYGFGFSIYGSMSQEPCINGDIRKLLRAGKFDLWKSKVGSGQISFGIDGVSSTGWATSDSTADQPIIEKSSVSGYGTKTKMVIRLQGKRTIYKIFANRPSEVSLISTMLSQWGIKPVSVRVSVSYTEAFLSSNKNFLYEGQIRELSIKQLLGDEELVSYIQVSAERLFREHCASCHGYDAQGGPLPDLAPSLVDNDWLYGGNVYTIEQAITNGRKGVMTAHGKILKTDEVDELVKAVMAGNPTEEPLYAAKGCIACHGPDGEGLQVLGAANLTGNIWRFPAQDQEQSVRNTIRHGVNFSGDPQSRKAIMPQFGGRLTREEIRKLAVYVYKLGGGQKE